jgi:hypothetical protein
MNVTFTYRDSIFIDSQNACLFNFQVLDGLDRSDEEVIMEFIKTDFFNRVQTLDDHPKWQNDSVWIGLNLPAFNFPLLIKDHFKEVNKTQLYHYLETCTNGLPWHPSQIEIFQNEAKWVKDGINKCHSDFFLFMSMDWFDENGRFANKANTDLSPVRLNPSGQYDPVLNSYAHIYGYYIIIFWVDREHSIISVAELSWD